ncbi:LuxR C-terminal-related transcriptional regulator [Chitinophaga rhizosphaerae]|uniref:LuxR C-terminal-related transcriptional regulator n=1 Tax=Chitinophaga rhizosphaerae TaxID=1864947 RepID=UPI00196A9DBB|nr:LuxR C-terminal-related transcriptional regulator [Chitinophaga rhizosphaerae]
MKNTPSKYYLTAKKFWKTVVDIETDADPAALQQQIELHKKLLNVFQAGNYFYFVFNMYSGDTDLMSPGVTNMLGYEPEEMSISFLMDCIHPDDKPFFLNFEHKVVEFFKGLPFEKVHCYKVQYDFRIKAKDGRYVRLLHQAVQIDFDEQNYYRTLCLETDITHIKPEGKPCFSIIGLDGEPSYYNIQDAQVFTKSFDRFTKQERVILKGIVEGKSSKMLAGELCISLNTVNVHRKNILRKAEVNTPLELVTKAIGEGWI